MAPRDLAFLHGLTTSCRQAPGVGLRSWRVSTQAAGFVLPEIAEALHQTLPGCSFIGHSLVWDAQNWSENERSNTLQHALQTLREAGRIKGWRDELFAFWSSDTEVPPVGTPPLFAVERAGFRPLGLLSHAVHINGFTPEGLLWCGRRSLQKTTDPGMLDNLTAGGLPVDESILECAMRELWEEAGLRSIAPVELHGAGSVRVSRPDVQGWHDEVLHVFNLTLPAGTVPVNQDGEVSGFALLSPREVLDLLRAEEFTVDAAVSLATGLGLHPAATSQTRASMGDAPPALVP